MREYRDLAERGGATFIQAAGGMLGANGLFDMGMETWKLAAAAGFAAALAVLKSWAKGKLK